MNRQFFSRPLGVVVALVAGVLLLLAAAQAVLALTSPRPAQADPAAMVLGPRGSSAPSPQVTATEESAPAAMLPTIGPVVARGPDGVMMQGDRQVGQSLALAINCARESAGLPAYRIDEQLSEQAAQIWQHMAEQPELSLDQAAAAYPLRAAVAIEAASAVAGCSDSAMDIGNLGLATGVTAIGVAAFVPQSMDDYGGISAIVIGQ